MAIIGAGIGAEHLDGYEKLPDLYRVKTLCDLDQTRARAVIGDRQIGFTDDFALTLQDDEIDLVDICLPPNLHFETAAKALRAGKHVICEKPLVGSLAQADELAKIAQETGRVLIPVFQYRYGLATAQLQALIEAGLAGAPLVANIETHWNREADYYATDWRGTWKGEGGGSVLIHAIHNHDMLCRFFGPAAKVSAMTTTRVNKIETEDCAAISFTMKNGALASSSITLGAADDQTRLRFTFETLTATSGSTPYAPADDTWVFQARGAVSQAQIDAVLKEVPKPHAGFAGFFEALAHALDGNTGREVTLKDGRASLELVSAIYYSARNETVVRLPIEKGHPTYDGWV